MKLTAAALRVDFAGGWLDVPALARPGAFIVNCTFSPLVTLASWPYEQRAGLGGSAAWALLSGRDALQEELKRAGWQDPACIMESGLCVWRSGPEPILERKINPDFLTGLMALQWTGQPHDTDILKSKQRDYKLIESAGLAAVQATLMNLPDDRLQELSRAIHLSHMAQQDEGMPRIQYGKALSAKYCGSGWGGYKLFLFAFAKHRDAFVNENKHTVAIEPYMRSVNSTVLLWSE